MSFTRTAEPSGFSRTTTFANSSGSTRRPCARTVNVSCWPGRRRLGADLPGGVHDVLRAQRVLHVGHREPEPRAHVGLEPDAHRVVGRAEVADVADALHAEQRVVDVDERVVREERRVVAAVGRVERDDHQRERERLLDGHAEVLHVLRQERLRLRVAVVDEDVVDVDVGADVERHDLVHRAVVGVRRLDVEHPVDAVHLLLDGRRDRLLDGERVRARVRRRQVHLRRQDLRELRDGQAEQRDDADEHREDGDDHRDDGAADEERGQHGPSLSCGLPRSARRRRRRRAGACSGDGARRRPIGARRTPSARRRRRCGRPRRRPCVTICMPLRRRARAPPCGAAPCCPARRRRREYVPCTEMSAFSGTTSSSWPGLGPADAGARVLPGAQQAVGVAARAPAPGWCRCSRRSAGSPSRSRRGAGRRCRRRARARRRGRRLRRCRRRRGAASLLLRPREVARLEVPEALGDAGCSRPRSAGS